MKMQNVVLELTCLVSQHWKGSCGFEFFFFLETWRGKNPFPFKVWILGTVTKFFENNYFGEKKGL